MSLHTENIINYFILDSYSHIFLQCYSSYLEYSRLHRPFPYCYLQSPPPTGPAGVVPQAVELSSRVVIEVVEKVVDGARVTTQSRWEGQRRQGRRGGGRRVVQVVVQPEVVKWDVELDHG